MIFPRILSLIMSLISAKTPSGTHSGIHPENNLDIPSRMSSGFFQRFHQTYFPRFGSGFPLWISTDIFFRESSPFFKESFRDPSGYSSLNSFLDSTWDSFRNFFRDSFRDSSRIVLRTFLEFLIGIIWHSFYRLLLGFLQGLVPEFL